MNVKIHEVKAINYSVMLNKQLEGVLNLNHSSLYFSAACGIFFLNESPVLLKLSGTSGGLRNFVFS